MGRSAVFPGSCSLILMALLAGLSACGGGSDRSAIAGVSTGGSSGTSSSSGTGGGWVAGVYQPSSHFAAQCQRPRSGIDPASGRSYPDVQGTTLDENNWLRSWTNELYLWYSEVPDIDPSLYSTTAAYFPLLKTSAFTSTGRSKDRFHFTYPTTQWEQMSQSGVDVGYGLTFDIISGTPPRQVYAAYVWAGYAAAAADVLRGSQILQIDGVDMVNASDQASVDTLNQGLAPTSVGESHAFVLLDPGATNTRSIVLQAAAVTETPVPIVSAIPTAAGSVGYILFNDHIATSEGELISAIQQLQSAGVTDLVLDMRYNGGGYRISRANWTT